MNTEKGIIENADGINSQRDSENMKDSITTDVNTSFKGSIKSLLIGEISTLDEKVFQGKDDPPIIIERPRIQNDADFSVNCSPIAFFMGKRPVEVASLLSDRLNIDVQDEETKVIEKAKAVGPYLNLKINKNEYQKKVIDQVLEKGSKYGFIEKGLGENLLLEHTSINPNASPHMGRIRNSIVGDFLVRLKRSEGYNVKAEYFVNDIGKQIALLLLGVNKYSPEDSPAFEELLDIYVKINKEVNNNPELEKQAFSVLENLEKGDKKVRKQLRDIVDICLNGQCKLFSQLGIYFDEFSYESDLVLGTKKIPEILEKLHTAGRSFIDESGRICVDLKGYNIPTKNPVLVLTRSDKTSLYPLRDIAYTISKLEKSPINNFVILGEDQKTYMQQISAVLDILGYKSPEPIFYSFVLLHGEKMATREGKVMLLSDVMSLLKQKIENDFAKRGINEVDSRKIEKIASSSIRYTILGSSRNKNVNFEIKQVLNSQGDSAIYVMYTFARINSLLSNSKLEDLDLDTSQLPSPTGLEHDILKKIGDYYEVINSVSASSESYSLVNYTNELCKLFSRYYSEEKILNKNDSKERKNQKLLILSAVRQVLANSMDIIGIEKLDKI